LRAEIKLLKDGLPAKREALTEVNRRKIKFQKGSDRSAFNELSAEITRDEERIKELEKQLYDLDMEAARNAVPLEWRK
jgi:cell division protein FtsB